MYIYMYTHTHTHTYIYIYIYIYIYRNLSNEKGQQAVVECEYPVARRVALERLFHVWRVARLLHHPNTDLSGHYVLYIYMHIYIYVHIYIHIYIYMYIYVYMDR